MASHVSGAGTGTAPRGTGHPMVSGWTVFAAVMMIFAGLMAVFEGVSAIAKDSLLVITRQYSYQFSLTGWGWIHLILGIVLALAGFALFTGALWARAVGVALAGLSMLANFAWLPWYPLWAIVVIALDILIIWALVARTGEGTATAT
ncbi:DUF7144 family membrane protein [Peterkaempfera bronchialis]|uniref:DUF7144 domain-containing protein n=1 Tax=Peterkaempfera bronchialis TaxID=2126346 RepID=A0A345SS76_9ACTN|nr:hypothetical protein [Peterkaempfera bronchialis]AXI76581.1 hypothetical protein C7M71_002935 [Peterkaempfera bronchialis]